MLYQYLKGGLVRLDKSTDRIAPADAEVVIESKKYVRKRKKRKHRVSIWRRIKSGVIWGIALGIFIFSLLFAFLSYIYDW